MPRASYSEVFAVREFRAVWASVVLSAGGDRLALVALTVLIYDRTRSPLLAAAAYAAGYLPWLVGGLFLSDLADRRPRRTVMVSCDAARAVLVAAMTVPGMPLAVLVVLLYGATMLAPPFESARAAFTPDILPGDLYALGASVIQTTFLTAEVAGGAVGGVAVAFLGVRPSLVIDAATFAASGLLIALFTRARPAPGKTGGGEGSPLARAAAGVRLVFGDPQLRTLVGFGWLAAFYAIPQGIAAPYAARLGGGPAATGMVMASTAVATAIGTPLFARLVRPRRRLALMGPLATATCATLILTAFRPGLAVSLLVFSASAAFGIYQIAANTAFTARVPRERRAQAFGVAGSGLIVVQGAAFVAAGAAAEVFTPAAVIAAAGAAGAVIALLLTVRWRRLSPPGGRHAARGHRHARTGRQPAACYRVQPAADRSGR
jgi:MFS family permease